MNAARAAQLFDVFGVDDLEFEPELLEHLDAPFFLQRRRADDEDGAGAVTQQYLLDDETGLDRLAEPDVVGDQQIGAGHVDRAD